MPEWPNGHDWKSCVGPKSSTVGSNPTLSAIGGTGLSESVVKKSMPHDKLQGVSEREVVHISFFNQAAALRNSQIRTPSGPEGSSGKYYGCVPQ